MERTDSSFFKKNYHYFRSLGKMKIGSFLIFNDKLAKQPKMGIS